MNKKLNKVLQLFQDTLMYSSKTYYQEEIYKREKITKTLQNRVSQLEKKHRLLKQHHHINALMAGKDGDDDSSSTQQQDEVAGVEYNHQEDSDQDRIKKEEIMQNLQ
mmetsp:Transcript_7289/g.8736  ORF Transcript_7289/g.8736 Transcript_7289/m.8736 type:complete len:107 (+) Transcript_7289:605-925(+)|eukprot:CAMPEP_0170463316 /NCGR_PEP_ID=MMETSP0123-20130129/8478_1 /TAXON_ID=182087 /ORGANISM="Favella ehrenbergii, Strain Fehren 1" /LENGTH=106 /DNA_ID=CAMNT_0010728727 /DNA_START=557 /DNA_END=877 /DNA_ORIENTATION=-